MENMEFSTSRQWPYQSLALANRHAGLVYESLNLGVSYKCDISIKTRYNQGAPQGQNIDCRSDYNINQQSILNSELPGILTTYEWTTIHGKIKLPEIPIIS